MPDYCDSNHILDFFSDNKHKLAATNDTAEHSSVPLQISSPIINEFLNLNTLYYIK